MAKISFYKPPLGEEEAQAVASVVKTGWVTFGKKTEEFEEKFAKYIKAPYCVMVNSCTHALFLSLTYWKEKKDIEGVTEITVPSLTCAATALAPIWAGIKVKLGDLEKDLSFSLEKTSGASIPVHYAGKYNQQSYPIVEDSAHRILPNSFTGVTTCFSFYATKNLTTGEGGMIACQTKEEAIWYKKARLYGINKAAYKREGMFQTGDKFWEFESEFLGYKCNPNDMIASIGLVQLSRMPELNAERSRVAKLYNGLLERDYDREAWHLYPILVNDRDKFMLHMKEKDIFCSVHFVPLHQQKAFKEMSKHLSFKVTNWVYDHIVSLPFYPYMESKDIKTVAKEVLAWEKKHGKCKTPEEI